MKFSLLLLLVPATAFAQTFKVDTFNPETTTPAAPPPPEMIMPSIPTATEEHRSVPDATPAPVIILPPPPPTKIQPQAAVPSSAGAAVLPSEPPLPITSTVTVVDQAIPAGGDGVPSPTRIEHTTETKTQITPAPIEGSGQAVATSTVVQQEEVIKPVVSRGSDLQKMESTVDSYWLESYPINDLYQFLARKAGLQYFQNQLLSDVTVTGEMFKNRDPLECMEDVALQFGVVMYRRRDTIYCLTQDQLAALPQTEFRYELRYLRPAPADMERMLGRFLTPSKGFATLEPKVNTIVVVDNQPAIQRIARHLAEIDKPKSQISIVVRALSVSVDASKRVGVDWSATLGADGLALTAQAQSSLDLLFGFSNIKTFTGTNAFNNTSQSGIITRPNESIVTLGPVEVNAVIRALYENADVSEESSPMVMTEDNEEAVIRFVRRQPIITSTVTESDNTTIISNEVRYTIGPDDATEPPQQRREIGTAIAITPTSLPDNTVRMKINASLASIVDQVPAVSGPAGAQVTNFYPVVREATLDDIFARIPNGYSIFLGGLSNPSTEERNNKVPLLGDLPLLGQAFRSKQTLKRKNNLVFIITASKFDPASPAQAVTESERLRQKANFSRADYSPDPEDLGENAKPSLKNKLRAKIPSLRDPQRETSLLDPENPDVRRAIPVVTEQEVKQQQIIQRYRK